MCINNRGFPCGVATWCALSVCVCLVCVLVCVCVCVCIHIYMYVYIYIYIYICTLTHTHRCAFTVAEQHTRTGVPSLSLSNHDVTRRFIILIDELYEHRCRFVCKRDPQYMQKRTNMQTKENYFTNNRDLITSTGVASQFLHRRRQRLGNCSSSFALALALACLIRSRLLV